MDRILEYIRDKIRCNHVSDLRNSMLLQNIVKELVNAEDLFSREEIIYLLRYVIKEIED